MLNHLSLQIPLAEMEALSLTSDILSEKSWSLALTDDSFPDDTNTLLLNALESNVHTLVAVCSDVCRVLNTAFSYTCLMAFVVPARVPVAPAFRRAGRCP